MRLPRFSTRSIGLFGLVLGLSGLLLCGGTGCSARSFFDPSEMGAYPKTPLIVPILDQLDTGHEEGDERFARATNVRPADLQTVSADYVVSPNDLLQISIEGLQAPGIEYFRQMRVTETGNISLPYVGQIRASGLTEAQLEQAIEQTYRDRNLIERAQVSVTSLEARGRTFTIMGNVALPGQYAIFDSNFRLLDALALARGVTGQGITHIYVIRRLEHEPDAAERAPDLGPGPATEPAPDVLTPQSRNTSPRPEMGARRVALLKTQAQDPPAQEPPPGEGRIIIIDGKPVQVNGGEQVPMETETQPFEPAEQQPMELEQPAEPFEFNELEDPSDVRIIRVPYEQLQRGDLRYNIVIRPRDMIIIPDPVIGEYYMGGHVARTGVYSLTARDITLTQAIIAAGMLDQLAVPWRTEIRRRIGPDREIIASVNLSKIFAGQEPNIYLKPYDQIMVGTDIWAPFLAAARNGFRITYGFGFLYDRNYAPQRPFN